LKSPAASARPQRSPFSLAPSVVALEVGDDTSLAYVLSYRAAAAIDAGRLEGVDADVAEIETAARTSGNQTSLAMAEEIRGRAAAVRGDLAGGRRWLADSRRILLAAGEVDLAAETGLTAAAVELEAGNGPAAARLAEQSAAIYRDAGDTDVAFGAATLLARVDCQAGRIDAARRHLAALGTGAERRPSIPLRLQFFAARTALALAEGRVADARRDLARAIELARSAERKLEELDLRLTMAQIQRDEGDAGGAAAAVREVGAEASRLGLAGLAARARALASLRREDAAQALPRPSPHD
jgi:hypothetical protein